MLEPHHVGIVVSDLEASRDFYQALGFAVDSEQGDDEKKITFMRLEDLYVELFWYRDTPPPSAGRTLGFKHLALRTTDLDDALSDLQAHGFVSEHVAIRDVPGIARLAFFPDPDGLEIELMEENATFSDHVS